MPHNAQNTKHILQLLVSTAKLPWICITYWCPLTGHLPAVSERVIYKTHAAFMAVSEIIGVVVVAVYDGLSGCHVGGQGVQAHQLVWWGWKPTKSEVAL